VASYVIDFPNEDVLGIENIITIPHLGASTPESEDNCAFMAANQLREYILKGNIVNSVNYPDAELNYTGKTRICVLSKGVCVEELTKAVSSIGKIMAMITAENKGYGYAIFDIEGGGDVSVVEKIDNVVKVRLIKA